MATTPQTLGQQLAAQLSKRAEEEAAAIAAQRASMEKKDTENRSAISAKFTATIDAINDAIKGGRPFKSPKFDTSMLLQSAGYMRQSFMITDDKHSYHDLWLQFKKEMIENDLEPNIAYRHDGMGEKSWFEIEIEPIHIATLRRNMIAHLSDLVKVMNGGMPDKPWKDQAGDCGMAIDVAHSEATFSLSEDKPENLDRLSIDQNLLFALRNLVAVHEGQGGTAYHAGDIARAAIDRAQRRPYSNPVPLYYPNAPISL